MPQNIAKCVHRQKELDCITKQSANVGGRGKEQRVNEGEGGKSANNNMETRRNEAKRTREQAPKQGKLKKDKLRIKLQCVPQHIAKCVRKT